MTTEPVNNPWIESSGSMSFWKQQQRIEVKLTTGETLIVPCPSCAKNLIGRVTHWRLAPIYQPRVLPSPGVSKAREVPKIYKHVFKGEWFRTFGWRERLAILLGANLYAVIRIPMQHNPGDSVYHITGLLCKSLNPEDAKREWAPIIAQLDNPLVDQEKKP